MGGYKKKIEKIHNEGREIRDKKKAADNFVAAKKTAQLAERKEKDRKKMAVAGAMAAHGSVGVPKAALEAMIRQPKTVLERKKEKLSHSWTEPGPMGLKLKAVSTVSLDVPEGVYVEAVTKPESIPPSVASMRIAEIHLASGEKHVGLRERSYNEVLGLIKASGRPVTILFHSEGYEEPSSSQVEEEAATLAAMSLGEAEEEEDLIHVTAPVTGLVMAMTGAAYLPETTAGQKRGLRGTGGKRGPPRGGYDTGLPGLYE